MFARQSLERVDPPILQLDSRRGQKRPSDFRCQDLLRLGGCHDPRGLVNGDAFDVCADNTNLSDVYSGSDLKLLRGGR